MISPWTILSFRLVTNRSYPSLPTLLILSNRRYRSSGVSPFGTGFADRSIRGWFTCGSGPVELSLSATDLICFAARWYDSVIESLVTAVDEGR